MAGAEPRWVPVRRGGREEGCCFGRARCQATGFASAFRSSCRTQRSHAPSTDRRPAGQTHSQPATPTSPAAPTGGERGGAGGEQRERDAGWGKEGEKEGQRPRSWMQRGLRGCEVPEEPAGRWQRSPGGAAGPRASPRPAAAAPPAARPLPPPAAGAGAPSPGAAAHGRRRRAVRRGLAPLPAPCPPSGSP